MAGSFISVDVVGQKQIGQALNRLLKQGSDLEPALRDIGEYLLESTQQRFIDQQAPNGEPWDPLSPKTLAKKKRQDRVLTETGTLVDTLHYQLGVNQLTLGSNMEYAATHQFGRESDGIPARPFLGIAVFERVEILAILRDHLN
ncbi:phage virion morphogenesis protein [Colwellia sp. 6_MG-2023]|jgi:phage virion morphogenesis protein|uniref:phage virion morphogenesis protein n=1 Tax=Colwellia sp. 6_MG-2023 TaxID=3062676 RepID=UPI0026E2AAFD|nr:phage virion morphogenesis protein [Colwellia sp. 6_MG-2023]MDO6488238.1 phage virion morphogenesis protein [Colwellia sp. 6_MG-2023]